MQLNLVDVSGRTALHVATQDGQLNALMEMLGRSVNVDARDAAAETPLHNAARSGKVSAVGVVGQYMKVCQNLLTISAFTWKGWST